MENKDMPLYEFVRIPSQDIESILLQMLNTNFLEHYELITYDKITNICTFRLKG